ncbi:MAG: hypothetical protein QUS14_14560 [Pyrinomonadaceae bacterium]|nr:hypothetical protein [Pyrinomonadaceae bacterium]
MRICILAIALLFPAVAFSQTPAEIEREFLVHLEDIGKYGSYAGGYDEEKILAANAELRRKLLDYGKRLDVLSYSFPKLKGEMFVATSNDGKLRIYSWDLQTGGTMHDYDAVFQYVGKSGKVHTWATGDEEDVFGSFFTEIFQVNARSGPIYLAVSTFVGSTSLNGQSIRAMAISGDRLDQDVKVIKTPSGLKGSVGFAYDFFSVVDRPERPIKLFKFDEARKEFSFPVVIEDEQTRLGRVTNRFITYRFDGKNFVRKN